MQHICQKLGIDTSITSTWKIYAGVGSEYWEGIVQYRAGGFTAQNCIKQAGNLNITWVNTNSGSLGGLDNCNNFICDFIG